MSCFSSNFLKDGFSEYAIATDDKELLISLLGAMRSTNPEIKSALEFLVVLTRLVDPISIDHERSRLTEIKCAIRNMFEKSENPW